LIPASPRLTPIAFALIFATAAAWGQSETPKPLAETPAAEVLPEAPPVPAPPPPVVRIPDRGDFKVVYEKTKNPDYLGLQQIFKETQLLQETVRALNDTLAMPADVTAALRECGTADAPYDPEKRRISICYELIDSLSDLFTADVTSEEGIQQAGIAVAGATLFIFFHEAGHALIRLDALPTTGREEDAVDQLATLLLLESGRQGEKAALDGATTFLAREKDAKSQAALARLAFWSAHALDQQRFANVICWVYGKSQTEFQYLVEDGTLAADRAPQCPAEYEQMAKTWGALLAPYLKGPGLVPPPATPLPSPPPPRP
jgi:Putative metallopeptidase